jgi:hypothetical protein
VDLSRSLFVMSPFTSLLVQQRRCPYFMAGPGQIGYDRIGNLRSDAGFVMAGKDADFDPYHKWLGIPRELRPVTHYLLLGISPKEADVDVIEDAATRQSSHVRTYQLGSQAEICQRVLNEIAQARTVLLNLEKRKAYDATLPKPKAKPAPVQPVEDRPTLRRQPPKSNTGMIVSIATGSVVLVVALIGGAAWLSTGTAPTGPSVKKGEPKADRPKPVAVAEKKTPSAPEPSKIIEAPKPVEPKVENPPIAKVNAGGLTIETPKPIEPRIENPPIAKANAGGLTIEPHQWHNGMPKLATLMRKNEGIAIFGGATGSYNGFQESIKVFTNDNGEWSLEGSAKPKLEGYVHCVTGLPKGWFELDNVTSAWWEQRGAKGKKKAPPPIEILPENDGVCWLSGLSGAMAGAAGVRVYRANGKWFLDGETHGVGVGGRAIVLPFGKNVDRSKLRISEIEWRPKDGPVKLLDVKDGFCALTEIYGKFQAPKQRVKLSVKDGAWWIEGHDSQGNLRARALRVSLTGNLPTLSGESEPALAKGPPKIEPKAVQPTWPTRQPIPAADTLAAKLKSINELLPLPGPKATVEETGKHVRAILVVGFEAKADVPLRYAALREAFELAYPLGDPDVADQALASLEADYVVEPPVLKMAALSRAVAKATDPSASRMLTEAIDEFTEDAIAADDLERAEKACALGVVGVQKSKDAALMSAAVKRLTQIRVLAKSFQTCKAAQAVLAKMPDDPKACTDAGSYLTLGKGDWDEGLELLAKGSDAKLRALAEKDLAQPEEADARQALGDGWAEVAEREAEPFKRKAASRARYWYEMIVGELGGVERLRVEKRMNDLEKLIPIHGPMPTARWTFDIDARDSVGEMHGKIAGSPKFTQGRMLMGPQDRMHAMLPFDVSERTLEIWCYLETTMLTDRSVIRMQSVDQNGKSISGKWDGIMFGFKTGRIHPGSDFGKRSRELDIPLESSRPNELLHLAAVYARDNTVTLYRNGKILGESFRPERRDGNNDLATYRKGQAAIVIGGALAIEVEEARLYTRALSAGEIAMSYRTYKK